MTNMRKFGGKGLIKLDDVCGTPFCDEIVAVTESQYGRPVLHFKCGRQFSLNVTNTEIMLKAYGDDDHGWIGQEVELYPGMLPRNGGGEQEKAQENRPPETTGSRKPGRIDIQC
jgi:hypothetical protein